MILSKPEDFKKLLLDSIQTIEKNPGYLTSDSAFSRTGKISFEQAMLFPILAEKDNLRTEITELFPENTLPSPSALCQKRSPISAETFENLFHLISDELPYTEKFKGFRLIACDGSRLDLPYNPKDLETFVQNIEGRKGYNQMHLTTLFDLLNNVYLDVSFQYGNEMDERRDFCTMIDCFKSDDKCIFICDRGFSSYNTFAHVIHDNQFFLFRLNPSMDISKFIDPETFSGEQFDQQTEVVISRKKNKKLSAEKHLQYIPGRSTYDYLDKGSTDTDSLNIRFVKVLINKNTTEYLATNLPESFSTKDLKQLYHKRWGIETSFRHLKYPASLIYVHSLKRQLTLQEIYGKLILFNISTAVERLAEKAMAAPKPGNKYKYNINVSQTIKYCVKFLKNKLTNLTDIIIKCLVPDKPERQSPRILRRQAARTLGYR